MNSQCSPTEEERHTRTLKNRQCKTVFWVAALATALLALPAAAADGPAQLPDPDNKAPDTRKPIKVFILSGQSNMCGMGSIAKSLDPLVKKKGMFQHLVDDDGNWTTRNDVFYMYNLGKATKTKACALSVHVNGRNVGPELQFGHIMGHIHGEVVLVIKACCGNRCLAYDVLPPSRREGRFSNEKWPLGCEYDNWFIKYTKGILKDLSRVYPDYKGQGYEIAGFGWWQGHKDGLKPEWTKEYEENLVAFIKDLRKDFNAPKAPFVVATVAFGGKRMSGKYLKILEAQMAVGDAKKHPEFAGNVASVDCRDFYRGGGAHYGNNAETYMLVGDAMGRAMASLLQKGGRTPATDVRVWTNVQGRKLKASLHTREGDTVKLRKQDGSIVTTSVSRLSPADRAYLERVAR